MTTGNGCWNCGCKWCWYKGKREYPYKCFGYIEEINLYYSNHT